LYICDLAITSNIESEFFSLLENISRQNTSIWYIDHHRLSTDLKNSLEKINVNLVISDQDCTSAIIYERFENNLDRNDSLLTACASITDNLENGIIGRKIINQHEKMFLFLNSSLLWFTIRSNQDNQTKLNTIVDRLSQNKLPYELLDDFSDLKSFLEELHHSILEIEKNLSNLSREIVILSNNKTNKNIGLITNSLCTKFDGAGGGDSKKSAAVIPERNFENFLQELNNSI
jgi:oligoribonuclease NrnB/cAMP/cGMP phosphodiesterase (DHH superfamily)